MKNWRQDRLECLAKREKVRSSRLGRKASARERLRSGFEKEEKDWGLEGAGGGCFAARVVEVHKRYAFVSVEPDIGNLETSNVWLATIARKYTQAGRRERNFITVGDRVLCRPGSQEGSEISEDLPSAIIEHRIPRKSRLARPDPMTPEREHVLAANMDQMVVIASYLYPRVKWGLIDRYLVLAEEQGLDIVLILNKKDLLKEQSLEFQKECQENILAYRELGYRLESVQACSPGRDDLGKIQGIFTSRVSLVTGHSGVGKSSLVNLLDPEIEQDVESEQILTRGRHTTTYSSLIKLGSGGFVIDTPGIRSLMMERRSSIELSWCFVEMRPYLGQCRFRECRHVEEPGCAILRELAGGRISARRYRSYLAILTGASGREGRGL